MLRQLAKIPNLLTFYRIFVAFIAASCLYTSKFLCSFLFYLSGVLSDFLDGFIARQYNMETKLGIILDPIADKVLIVSYIAVLYLKNFPYRPSEVLVFSLLLKEFVVFCGAFFSLRKKILFKPNIFGKTATTFLFLDGLLLLYENWFKVDVKVVQHLLELSTSLVLIATAVLYIKEGLNKVRSLS